MYRTINLTSACSDISQAFYPPIQLKGGEMALARLETYNSIANVDKSNNVLHYELNGQVHLIEVPVGAYEISEINDYVQTKTKSFEIIPNVNTLKCIVRIHDPEVKVHFNHDRTMRQMLGFEAITVQGHGDHEGSSIVDILRVNSVNVNCDLITGSYVNGSQYPVLYSFFPNVPPGYKVVEVPTTPIYLPINTDYIQSIRLWLTDQNGGKIDLRGQKLTITLLIRSSKE